MANARWIKCGLPWYAYNTVLSFCGRELNKAGTLVEVSVNGELKQYLIGDINNIGGVCDDCTAFPNEAIVTRYKVIYERTSISKSKRRGLSKQTNGANS